MSDKKHSFVKIMLKILPIQFKSGPVSNILSLLLGVTRALLLTAGVITSQHLFDAITGTAGGEIGFTECVIALILLATAALGSELVSGVWFWYYSVVHSKAGGYIGTILYRKLRCVDPVCFEDTSFLDDLNKAKDAAYLIPHFTMTSMNVVFYYGVYFASVGAYLFTLKPLLLVTLLLSFIPAMLSQIVRAKVFTKLEEVNAPIRRENEYYQKTLCGREYFKETRILGAYRYFHKLFSDTMLLLTRKTWQAERKTALLQILLNLTTFAGMAIASYLLFDATMANEITVGAFAAVFASLGRIFYIMQEIIVYHIGIMNKDIGKVTNFIRMLNMPERTGADGLTDFSKGITAENIRFTYPGRDEPAVRGVSLRIDNGETIAIVGENGAGKSTLVRLLTGIYLPSEGKVMVGGLDTAQTAPQTVFTGISGVFQRYQRYKMTLTENVTISDIGDDAPGVTHPDTTRIKAALKEADAELKVSLDTMLSPEFDGIDLSGGQWQRVAIARGLYRKNSFIVLDEPTAAIDPVEETRIYRQFQRLAEGKCAVIVTHRLGSAKLAHRIIVMDGGKIVDTGTHQELISRPGKYADMWAAQAKWYERETG